MHTQQKSSTLIPYEVGVSTLAHITLATLQGKLDAGKELNAVEEHAMKGFACLEKELRKKPEERIPYTFAEVFESLLDLPDEVDYPVEDGSRDMKSGRQSPACVRAQKKIVIASGKRSVAAKMKEPKLIIESTPLVTTPPGGLDEFIGEAELSEGDYDENHGVDKSIDDEQDENESKYDHEEITSQNDEKDPRSTKESPAGTADKPKNSRKAMLENIEIVRRHNLRRSGKKERQYREDLDFEMVTTRESPCLRNWAIDASSHETRNKRRSRGTDKLLTAKTKDVSPKKRRKKVVEDLIAQSSLECERGQLLGAAKKALFRENNILRKELWREEKNKDDSESAVCSIKQLSEFVNDGMTEVLQVAPCIEPPEGKATLSSKYIRPAVKINELAQVPWPWTPDKTAEAKRIPDRSCKGHDIDAAVGLSTGREFDLANELFSDKCKQSHPASFPRAKAGVFSSLSQAAKESKKNGFACKSMALENRRSQVKLMPQILKRVPAAHKKLWGQIMFSRVKTKQLRPVLVLNPLQAPLRIRSSWMRMFENVSHMNLHLNARAPVRLSDISSVCSPREVRTECFTCATCTGVQSVKRS